MRGRRRAAGEDGKKMGSEEEVGERKRGRREEGTIERRRVWKGENKGGRGGRRGCSLSAAQTLSTVSPAVEHIVNL